MNIKGPVDIARYERRIVDALLPMDPIRIVLFGSNSERKGGTDSDLDILVVLDSTAVCTSYEERLEERMKVQRKILDVSFEVPIDLLVYTKNEFEIVRDRNRQFFDEIESKGKILYGHL